MDLTVGSRWQSAVSTVQLIVVAPPVHPAELQCGGEPVVGPGTAPGQGARAVSDATAPKLGKRYVDDASGLEVLCTRAGGGALAVDGRPMELKTAKPLPASD
jgi:hypothetical protein